MTEQLSINTMLKEISSLLSPTTDNELKIGIFPIGLSYKIFRIYGGSELM